MRLLPFLLLLPACGDGGGSVPDGDDDDDVPVVPTDTDPTPTVPGECAAIVSATSDRGVQPLEQRLEVTLDGPGTVWATCTSPQEPEELHLLESPEGASHALVLRGLLGGTDYVCTVHAGCGGPTMDVAFTSGVPDGVPVLEVSQNPDATPSGAYTLFPSQPDCNGKMMWALMTDLDGQYRWMYPVGEDLVADIDLTLMGPDTMHVGGGWGIFDDGAPNRGVFRTIDLSGHPLLERQLPDFGLGFNHHSEPLDDGSYLTLTGNADTNGSRSWNGNGVELWSPTAGLLWTWDSQGLVDQGFIDEPDFFDPLPYHANAATLRTDAHGEAVWLSIFGLEEIWRIDRATGELTDVFGHDGDFTLVDPAGQPLPESEFPWVQHGVDYDGERMLVYDNGSGRPGGSYSRVAEYTLDLDAREATLEWSWTEPGWYDPIVGDADWLPGGHVLVTQGFNKCLDFFGDDVSEIVELAPPDTVVWRMAWPNRDYTVYRSERYDGCAVFANARYCPAVAARIAQLGG